MYKSNVFNSSSSLYQPVKMFITLSMFENIKIFKPNWFVSLLFPLPEGIQVSTATQFCRLENRFL
jgi:hypothetical protein